MGFGKREQEFLVLVLGDQLDERRERSVGEKYLALAVYDVFRGFRSASVLQKYFIPSGIVMRACSQIRKKLSIVVRLVKMTALCSNISTR